MLDPFVSLCTAGLEALRLAHDGALGADLVQRGLEQRADPRAVAGGPRSGLRATQHLGFGSIFALPYGSSTPYQIR